MVSDPSPLDPRRQTEEHAALAARVAALERQVAELRAGAIPWRLAFHPAGMVILSLGAATVFAALILLDRELSTAPGRHFFFLYYMVPISAAFVAFLLDRIGQWQRGTIFQVGIDALTIIVALARAFYEVPLISGHSLFLTYALVTTRSIAARILAAIVFIQVFILKAFIWQDHTLYGGILVGLFASILWNTRRSPE